MALAEVKHSAEKYYASFLTVQSLTDLFSILNYIYDEMHTL